MTSIFLNDIIKDEFKFDSKMEFRKLWGGT